MKNNILQVDVFDFVKSAQWKLSINVENLNTLGQKNARCCSARKFAADSHVSTGISLKWFNSDHLEKKKSINVFYLNWITNWKSSGRRWRHNTWILLPMYTHRYKLINTKVKGLLMAYERKLNMLRRHWTI